MITLRGFTIRSHRTTDGKYQDTYHHVWAPAGELPGEWDQIKSDDEIDRAQLYKSSQRRIRADKRKYIDTK